MPPEFDLPKVTIVGTSRTWRDVERGLNGHIRAIKSPLPMVEIEFYGKINGKDVSERTSYEEAIGEVRDPDVAFQLVEYVISDYDEKSEENHSKIK